MAAERMLGYLEESFFLELDICNLYSAESHIKMCAV